MENVKMEKWLIDGDLNLTPWEKFELKLCVNSQIDDYIDREAENRCDWVDYSREIFANYLKCNFWHQEIVQLGLFILQIEAETQKRNIRWQAENEKLWRDEQECARRIQLIFATLRQPIWNSCTNRFA